MKYKTATYPATQPPLHAWVLLQTRVGDLIAFTYRDPDAGVSAKGIPLLGDLTDELLDILLTCPPVTVRLGLNEIHSFKIVTGDEQQMLRLPPAPPWSSLFDDGTIALFDSNAARTLSRYRNLCVAVDGKRIIANPVGNSDTGCYIEGIPAGTFGRSPWWHIMRRILLPKLGALSQEHSIDSRTLDQISDVGREIARLDRIAADGTEAVRARGCDLGSLNWYVSYSKAGQWRTAFGVIENETDSVLTRYEAIGTTKYGYPYEVKVFVPGRKEVGWLSGAARAQRKASAIFQRNANADAYNTVVLSGEASSFDVYFYPASVNCGRTVIGADGVISVDAAGVTSIKQYHRSLLKIEANSTNALICHTHIDGLEPVPTDVAYVLMGHPPAPSLVLLNSKQAYLITSDGSIVSVELPLNGFPIDRESVKYLEKRSLIL